MKRTLAFLAAAEGADVLTTWYAIGHGSHEVNPVAVALIGLSPFALVAVKALPVAYTAGLGAVLRGRARDWTLQAARVVAFCLFLVAAFNLGGVR